MGILKAILFVAIPTTGLTIAAFRLGPKLPLACRLFGNYIGLSYVYFKSLLAFLKPADHMPYEMISLARKTSQQVLPSYSVASPTTRTQINAQASQGRP